MIKTSLSLSFIILCFSFSAMSQRFEGALIAGISASQIDGDAQSGYKKPGVYAGCFVETNFNDLFGAKIELYYIGKGAVNKVDGIDLFNTSLHYIEMPLVFCIKPIDHFEFDVGIAGSYLISSKQAQYSGSYTVVIEGLHNFDFSGIVSLIYYFGEHMGACFKYNYSILPIKSAPYWYNNNINLGLIYKF